MVIRKTGEKEKYITKVKKKKTATQAQEGGGGEGA